MNLRYKPFLLLAILLLVEQVAYAQFTVTGTVIDKNTGDLLVGANVFHAESNTGATTDVDGTFSIRLPGQSATIRISYVGYISRTIQVSATDTKLRIELSSDISNLEEVVVTGLASTVKRSNLANSISSINADNISGKVAPPTVDRAMQGKIPGIEIMSTGGAPGGGFNVQLRGVSTLGAGNSQPLYIIDGVYVDNSAIRTGRSVVSGATSSSLSDEEAGVQDGVANRLADLNPEDIRSIEVLKGPSAAAIYGQRANAGVIIINTKQSIAGNTQVSVNQEVGFSTPLNLLDRTNWTEDRIIAFWDDPDTPGLDPRTQVELDRFQTAQQNGTIRDMEKVFFDNRGLINKTQISISGGDEKTQFFVSGSLDNEDGIIKNTGFDRNSIRANLSHNITDKISITSNTNYVNSQSNRGFTGNQNNTGGGDH
jgi:TonB-dependent SusC/RagA subfamily outer membrane receptor